MPDHRILGRIVKSAGIGLLSTFLPHMAEAQGTSVVFAGTARFEFLTASLVRMEYSPSGKFVDAPTAVVQQRNWPSVEVQSTHQEAWLVISTSAMRLQYRPGSGPFTPDNLKVSWIDQAGAGHEWHPGAVDRLNLGGLTHSLDNVGAANLPAGLSDLDSPVNDIIPGIEVHLDAAKPGLLSRSGYAFIDDSRTPVWNTQNTWIEPREESNGQDWYLFVYDRDYRKVLREYAELCGPIPMIPRYVLGPSITDLNFEYFPDSARVARPELERYGQTYLEQEVARLRRNSIPFDLLILDFAWHNYGWEGGYDWSPLIPHPDQFSSWLHGRGVKLSLNDHPGYAGTAESILSFDDSHAPEVLKAMGRAPPATPSVQIDLSTAWRFSIDAQDQGLRQGWTMPQYDDRRWKPIRIGSSWQDQGYASYHGVGWYRASIQLPVQLPEALYLTLGEVNKTYRVFVNGQEAAHDPIQWPQRLTSTDITPYLKAGQRNEIVLRVEPGEFAGGIVRSPAAIRDVAPPKRIYFDLSNQQQADVFMRYLHKPLMQQGVDLWWVDGGSGDVDMAGLNKQLWTNKVFYDYTQQASGRRGFILGRYGDWGSERYPGFFTGDTYSEWPVLAYEVAFTARGGNLLIPYISHDIGGFHGRKIDFDLYARWIEFGTFSPLLRMHSAHENPHEGNLRMPWVYGSRGIALMRKYFTLRTQLLPYLYSYAWVAHRDSLPIMRPLYLQYPDLEAAYRHSDEYFFGEQLLVAPVLDASGNRTIYLPPGQWIGFFDGRRHEGASTMTTHYAVDQTPVFAREGALVPEQAVSDYSDAKPLDEVILNVFGSGNGRFELYEDDGISLAYAKDEYALTTMTYATSGDGLHRIDIEPVKGQFRGQVQARSYELRIHGAGKPTSIRFNGRDVGPGTWDAPHATAIVRLPIQPISEKISVEWR
ncbi:MAG TPA: TIM-barrel domain-containing protein [Steroidobacteraceae bacterium]|nr:TIM-barrel domain-containing protein [Steroidobacteraceae bacterium]